MNWHKKSFWGSTFELQLPDGTCATYNATKRMMEYRGREYLVHHGLSTVEVRSESEVLVTCENANPVVALTMMFQAVKDKSAIPTEAELRSDPALAQLGKVRVTGDSREYHQRNEGGYFCVLAPGDAEVVGVSKQKPFDVRAEQPWDVSKMALLALATDLMFHNKNSW